ncbi:hypothetical protein M0811_05773 [Anaeramoeba ignava]|uniref:Uncharacterized protein n=1 Tax=Anaeramoeba ignava TaxID=1746090 RepID=A0A9Q0LSE4_ANAIG|nr:hypothetical protein M0811_05773 [Anaeramoeba ignava]
MKELSKICIKMNFIEMIIKIMRKFLDDPKISFWSFKLLFIFLKFNQEKNIIQKMNNILRKEDFENAKKKNKKSQKIIEKFLNLFEYLKKNQEK